MNNDEHKYLFGFLLIKELTPAKLRLLLKTYSSAKTAWQNFDYDKLLAIGFDEKIIQSLIIGRKKINLEREWKTMLDEEIKMISYQDTEYPENLKEITAHPLALFYRGNISLLKEKQLAVVGTRKPTSYGAQVIEKFIPVLASAGLTITSGMAIGIDSLAHNAALQNNQKTIAVLGEGLCRKNLAQHSQRILAEKILQNNGLIVTEYPPFFKANRFTFPARNRIISGLSLGVLVVEASEKSGSLITAHRALEQNREVFTVPGNIFSNQSIGTNSLIKEGALPVTNPTDILLALNFKTVSIKNQEKINYEDEMEAKIHMLLDLQPIHIDQLSKKSGFDPIAVSAKISLMELKGLVRKVEGGMLIRG